MVEVAPGHALQLRADMFQPKIDFGANPEAGSPADQIEDEQHQYQLHIEHGIRKPGSQRMAREILGQHHGQQRGQGFTQNKSYEKGYQTANSGSQSSKSTHPAKEEDGNDSN